MNKQQHKQLHQAAAAVLGLATAVHLVRVFQGLDLQLGTWMAPMWVSYAVILVAGYLAYHLWKIS